MDSRPRQDPFIGLIPISAFLFMSGFWGREWDREWVHEGYHITAIYGSRMVSPSSAWIYCQR
jgi:hypothetical protein